MKANLFFKLLILPVLLLSFTGCTLPLPPAATETPAPTQTESPTPSLTPSPSPIPPTPSPTPFEICSPLENVTRDELDDVEIFKNPLITPVPGTDGGHHGVDFAYYRWKGRDQMLGLPVYAVVSGKVVTVLEDKYPYGNAVIIETSLDQIPADLQEKLAVPTPLAAPLASTRLLCPPYPDFPINNNGRSLYTLYAHFDQLPIVKKGDQVTCGQQIGVVGTTGYSSQPHLHLEMRIGPRDYPISSMQHYTTLSTPDELAMYCYWRVSGVFQLVDPMRLLIP